MLLYEVYLINQRYTCGAYKTLEQAINMARKTGFQCNIFRSNNPFKIVKTICPIGGTR